MNVIPPDTDELLWEVARDPQSATADQFRIRYPELTEELERRSVMLRGLRQARRGPGDEIPEPRVLARQKPMISMPRWSLGVAATLLLFSFGLAFIAILNRNQGSLEEGAMGVTMEVGPDAPGSVATDEGLAKQDRAGFQRPTNEYSGEIRGSVGSPVPFAKPPFERLVTLQEQSISLTNAIQAITGQAGIKVTIAPGFEDKAITAQFKDVPALVALRSLGSSNGFRVVEQGNAEILVIPENSSMTPTLVDPPRGQSSGPASQGNSGQIPVLPPSGN